MSQPLRTRTRRQLPAPERRAQILDAALRCFSEKGFHEATMDDVARTAGVSKGSLYWHFRSKAELFAGLCEAWSLELFQAWQAEAEAHRGDVVGLVGRVGELSLERLAGEADLLRAWAEFIVSRELQDQFALIYRESRRLLGEWIQRGIQAGEIRPLPAESVAAAATAGIEGLLIQALVDEGFDARAHWRTWWEIFSRGIAA